MKRGHRHSAKGRLVSVFWGIVSAVAAFITVSFVMAAIAYSTANPTARVGIYSLSSLTLCGFVCGIVTSRVKKEGGIFCALLAALAVVALIFAVRLIIGSLTLSAALSAISFIGAALVGAYLARPKQRRHGR